MALRDVLVQFLVDVDQRPLEETQKKTDALIGTFKNVAAAAKAFVSALAIRELVGFVTETVKAADDVGDLAARLGVTTDEFQVFKAVAEDVGTSVGTIQTSFRTLAGQMKEGAGEFAKLGVATKNADGTMRSVTDVFWDAGTAIGATEDQATRLQLAQKLLGRGGLDLMPVFQGGAAAVAEYREQIENTAVVFDEEFIQAADGAAKQLADLQRRFTRIKVLLVSQILPAFQRVVDWLQSGVEVVIRFVKSGHALQLLLSGAATLFLRWASTIKLGVGHLSRLLPLVRALGRFLLRFALPMLIIDELFTLFRGGDTLIGRVIDKLFGIGSAAAAVELVKGAASSLIDTLGVLFNAGDMTAEEFEMAFIKASSGIADAFDAAFDGIGSALSDLGEFAVLIGGQIWDAITGAVGRAVDWVRNKINEIPGLDMAIGAVKAIGSGIANGLATPNTHPIFGAPAALSPAATAAAGSSVSAPAEITNNITVEGNATPQTAREIAAKTGAATGASLGRDRAAIAAAVGL